jgi:diguanylate cyclase (GGDEF)-like protein
VGLLSAILVAPACLVAQALPFSTYSTDDGLAEGVVLSLAQDSGGFLWAGTPDGLSRFDGASFRTFGLADGLPDEVVRTIFEARDGTLWIGTDDGLARRSPGQEGFTPTTEEQGRRLGSVRAFAQTPDGAVWAGTYSSGLLRFDPSGIASPLGTAEGLPGPQVRALQVDPQGRLWVGTYGDGVALIAGEHVVPFDEARGLANRFVRSFEVDAIGRLLVGTNDGIYRLSGEHFELIAGSAALGGSEVSSLEIDQAGRLWAGTRDRGACRLETGGVERCLGRSDGLADNGINDILADREGGLWFATFGGGLSRLVSEQFEVWTYRHGLPYDSVSAIAEGPPGVIWLATHGAGAARLDQGQVTVIDHRHGLPHDKIVSTLASRSGAIWFGTLAGVARVAPDGSITSRIAGLPSEVVLGLAEDHRGRVWVGTTGGIAVVTDSPGIDVVETLVAELPTPRVNALAADAASMWIGTGDGLVRWADGSFEVWSRESGLPDTYVQALHVAPDGALWVGTAAGLGRFQYGVFRTWGAAEGLAHNKIQAIGDDAAGRLWIGTTRGISVFDGSEIRSFSTRDGLTSSEVMAEAVHLASDGRLWMGTVSGAVSFLPGARSNPVEPPTIHLAAVAAADRQLSLHQPIELGHRENDLAFEFVGVSLAHADEVVYDVELRGLDSRPRRTTNRSVVYAAVPPGDYTFAVTASVRGISSSEAATIPLSIAPPLWALWWFKLALALAVLSAAFATHRSRLRAVRRRNAELQELLHQREQAEAAVRRYAGELEHKSLHDTLTDLPNRALLLDRVEVALARTRSNRGVTCAVICLDLDDFKLINDSRGHDAGDRVLIEMAARLGAVARTGDTLASLGGDDFVILLGEVHGAVEATRLGQELQRAVAQPLVLDGQEVVMSASVGIALDAGRYRRPEDLLRDADTALYRAKARGNGQCAIFDSVMYESTVRQLQLGTDLRRAVERDELRLHYQPIRRLSDNRVGHFEALLRWQHPQRGLLGPAEFLDHLHEVGLTETVGDWVLQTACAQAAIWAKRFEPGPKIAINLFSSQVMQLDLAERIRQLLDSHQLDPRQIGLEVTEGVLIEDPTTAIVALAQARTHSIEISLDDFGTGYSSLSYLERFPVDVLKIDRSFVSRLDGTNDSSRIVESILQLARSLGLRVVAEGVETEVQLERLRRLGCDYVQGYLVARPLTAADAEELLLAEAAAAAVHH